MHGKIEGRGGNYGAEMSNALPVVVAGNCYEQQPHGRSNARIIGRVREWRSYDPSGGDSIGTCA